MVIFYHLYARKVPVSFLHRGLFVFPSTKNIDFMNHLSIDHLLVGAFLLITLIVGLWTGRGVKDIRDYALGKGTFKTFTMTLTVIATYVGGGTLVGGSKDVFADGIIATLAAVLGTLVSFLFVAFYIAPKVTRFKDCITVGDLMGKFFGTYSRIITGLVGILNSIFLVGMQVLALGYASEKLLGVQIDSSYVIVLGGFLLIAYSAIGGIRPVAMTDLIQFFMLTFGTSLLAGVLTYKAGGLGVVFDNIPQARFEVIEHPKSAYYLALFIIGYLLPTIPFNAPYVQRMLMVKDERRARSVYVISGISLALIRILVMIIGFSALILYPNTNANSVFSQIISDLPIGIKGLVLTGLVAALMSSADSFLNAGGVLFGHDVVKPITDKMGIKINELAIARLGTLIIGVLGILVALNAENVTMLGLCASSAVALVYTIPLIGGIVGLKTDTPSFFIAMFCALVTFIIANQYLELELFYLALPIGLVASILSFLTAHLVRNKGFALHQYPSN